MLIVIQNLLYVIYHMKNPKWLFPIWFFFPPIINFRGKNYLNQSLNSIMEKATLGFHIILYKSNVANFELYCWNFSSITNFFFWRVFLLYTNTYTEYTARGVSIYTMLVDIFSENMRKALAFVSLNLFFFDVLLYYMIQNIYHARLLLLQSKIKI